MTSAGSVDIQIRLAREQLTRDIAELRRLLSGLPDVDLNTDPANRAASALQATLGGLSATAGLALSIVADKAKEAAIAFDSAKAKAATLTEDSSGLAKSMRDLSAELGYQSTSTDLLNSSYDVLSSGYSKTADVTNILKNSTYAAIGGFSNVNTVADATTTILNSYGKSVDQAAHVTDVLIATQNAGKITVAQYAGIIGQAATTAAQAGVSLEEFSAYVAGATAKGVQASSAVAGIRAAITAMLSPTLVASRLAKDLGVDFSAAALKSKGLSGVLADLNAKGAATPQVLTELFGSVEAVAAIMPSAGQNIEFFNKNLAYIQNSAGLAKDAADKVSNSFEGQLKRSANQANEAFVSLGQGILQVANPVVGASASILQAFNSLPEPVKQTLGVTIGLTGGMLTLGGAIATVGALTPIVTAGFAASAAALGLNSAATTANTSVTAASAAVTGVLTTELSLSNLALAASTIQSGVATTARNVYAAATGTAATATLGFASKLAILAVQAALVGGAVYAVSEAFKRSEGAKFSFTVEDNTRKMLEFEASLKKGSSALGETATKTATAASGFDLLGQTLAKSGPIEAARTGLAQLDQALGGTSDVTSTYGNSLAILTAEQRGNQLAMFALDKQLDQTGKTMDATNGILAKYGLLTVDAADKQRLGAEGIKKFKDEVSGQINVLDKYIDTLKSQKAPTIEQQQLIDASIKNLESQKQALRKRVLQVESDTAANKNNAQSLKDLILDVEALGKAYDKSTKDIALATDKNKASINEQIAAGTINQEQANTKLLQAEKKGLDDRKQLIATEIPKLEAAKVGAKPEEIEKVNTKIKELEGESANLRSQIAQNLVSQKKAANEEALKNEDTIAKASAQKILNTETQKATSIRELQLKGVISSQQASDQIDAIKIASTKSEIDSEGNKLSRIKVLRAQNAITAKQFAEQETEINSNITKLKLKSIEQEVQAQENARERELKGIERVNAQKLASVDNKVGRATIGIKQQEANGTIDAESAAKKVLAVEQEAVKERLALANKEYVQVDYLEAKKLKTKEQAADLRTDIEKRVVALSLEQVNIEVQARKDANDKILADLDRSNKAAEASITLSANQRILVAKQTLLAAGDTDKAAREAAGQLAAITRDSTAQQLQLLEKQAADVDRNEKNKVISAQKAAELRTGLEVQISQKNIELIDQQIAEVNRLKDEAIKAIQERADADKSAFDQTLNLLEQEKNARNSLIQAQQQEKDLLESQLNLQKAIAGLNEVKGQGKLASVDRAVEARRKLDSDPNLDPGVASVLNAQLKASGFANTSEADILTERRKLQNELAEEQNSAALREEKAARTLLDIELTRSKLTAEIALLEAQISDSKASQAQIQAKANLEKAQQLGDKNAIASAQNDIKVADLSKEVAAKSIDAAKRGVEMQGELAENAREALAAQQEGAQVQREAAHAAQDQAAALEIAEARAKEIARIEAKAKAERDAADKADEERESRIRANQEKATASDKGGISPAYVAPRESKANVVTPPKNSNYSSPLSRSAAPDPFTKPLSALDNNPSPQFPNTPINVSNGLEDLAKWSNQVSGAMGEAGKSSTLMESKLSNKDVVTELQKMNGNLVAIASRPSALNVTTANPVSDAADIYSNISKNAVRSANL
ncbi:phage tail tape measure protein [Nostoc sp. DedQUE07]|uniref:phage tail tape measure protein n=1 Tax=Nostoc sp. DedQUE07 TaxID=3075392 RepID=UPI002AD4D4E5|nr:phage tail tape measure protein [Nostoc sp. DedQUE07]MDZ8131992.1 phage tail tape measure protein [Nostoc sp. DedQUE07]